jgi:hypothetical protein
MVTRGIEMILDVNKKSGIHPKISIQNLSKEALFIILTHFS